MWMAKLRYTPDNVGGLGKEHRFDDEYIVAISNVFAPVSLPVIQDAVLATVFLSQPHGMILSLPSSRL